MENLLFYAAVVLLAISVISCIVYNVVCWSQNLKLFENLLYDENYPFEVTNSDELAKTADIKDFCSRCWAKTSFRSKTEGEKKLENLITGNGLFGGIALFLSFSLVPVIWGVIAGFVLAVLLQYVYRNLIFFIAHIFAWRKARKIYWQYRRGEL